MEQRKNLVRCEGSGTIGFELNPFVPTARLTTLMNALMFAHTSAVALACLLLASCESGTDDPILASPPGVDPSTPGVNGGRQVPCPAGSPLPSPEANDAGEDASDATADDDNGDAQGGTPALTRSLSSAYAQQFPIGAAVSSVHLTQSKDILEREFNHITAENAMKFASVQPSEGSFTFADADEIANFARQTGKPMTGHTLIWHRQSPSWLFGDLTAGETGSIEKLKQRMRTHIEAMVERYADIVDNWDVVNEAISDTSGKAYRDAEEGSIGTASSVAKSTSIGRTSLPTTHWKHARLAARAASCITTTTTKR